MTSNVIQVSVSDVEQLTDSIKSYILTPVAEEKLPAFTAGAHIDLLLENGLSRQYSLCSDPADTGSYQIAVLREKNSRGGSEYIHQHLKPGSQLTIHPPRNHFQLEESAPHYLLIAGGIGITPIMLMARRLKALEKSFKLHYLARTEQQAAFADLLKQELGDQCQCHFTLGQPQNRINLEQLVADQPPETHLYTCGSEPLLQSILAAASLRQDIRVHFERFAAAETTEAVENKAFEVELASSGEVLEVTPDQSILEVLRSRGHEVETMCEEGLCGSCEVGLLAGEADHRDSVLTEDEQQEQSVLMVCCSRAKSPRLKLDI
ncbi:PDR/VanB family oxidoreductase [Endozoicomonadaceae bacterium StTr2]